MKPRWKSVWITPAACGAVAPATTVQARAWTVVAGATAPQAAGVIHTDFQRGFIRAETISFDDYIACSGESGARDAGKLRIEGSDYRVVDGDVFHFRFNV